MSRTTILDILKGFLFVLLCYYYYKLIFIWSIQKKICRQQQRWDFTQSLGNPHCQAFVEILPIQISALQSYGSSYMNGENLDSEIKEGQQKVQD